MTFPVRPSNRPGLDRIGYRIGAYGEIREAMLHDLNRTALLAGWTHQTPDDPGIALLEGAAILGDILTLYQEVYANEAFLRTAAWRESVADLVRLLGYRLAPGLGGRGEFAFLASGTLPVPIPTGFPLTAQVAGMDGTADFETAEDLVAYPWLSAFSLFRPQATPPITSATTELVISTPDDVELAKGDKVLLGRPYPASAPTRVIGAQTVIVDGVRERHGRKLYRLRGALQLDDSASELVGFKLGRSLRHFGHTAPGTKVTISGGTATQSNVSRRRLLTAPTTDDVDPAIAALELPLDGKLDDLATGVPILLRSRLQRLSGGVIFYTPVPLTVIRTVTAIRQGAYTWGALTGAATVVGLDHDLSAQTDPAADTWTATSHLYDRLDIREAEVLETRTPLLRLRAAPQDTAATSGHDLYFVGTDAQVQSLAGRRVLLTRAGADPQDAVVQSVQSLAAADAGSALARRVTLDATVAYPDYDNDAPSTVVYGNVALATQGKSERATPLGNGDSRAAFQTFKLPKAPLTYLTDAAASPPEVPELEIRVDDLLWTRVPTLFGHGPEEQVYIVREDADGNSWVQFGDGLTGAQLPSGIANVVAVERSGQGAFGALKPGTKAQAGARATGLDKVELPGVVSGGQPPEDGDDARAAAPGRVQSLGRVVSIRDFETEALAIAGVTLAAAAWQLVDNVAAVVVDGADGHRPRRRARAGADGAGDGEPHARPAALPGRGERGHPPLRLRRSDRGDRPGAGRDGAGGERARGARGALRRPAPRLRRGRVRHPAGVRHPGRRRRPVDRGHGARRARPRRRPEYARASRVAGGGAARDVRRE